jgi:hypothetical protein
VTPKLAVKFTKVGKISVTSNVTIFPNDKALVQFIIAVLKI